MRRLLESSVYKRAVFISKIKIEENEIMCQLKNDKIFLKPCDVKLKTKDVKYDLLSLSSNKRRFLQK